MRGYRDGLEYGGVVACSGEDQALRFRIYSKAWLPEEKRSEN